MITTAWPISSYLAVWFEPSLPDLAFAKRHFPVSFPLDRRIEKGVKDFEGLKKKCWKIDKTYQV